MGTVSAASPEKMYSWWWDSHKCPKNSKWLQENLTDMDVKVKQMIKLIEEDADSFARRAEMYYKKRPELMKLVEEFYRAYRALAERYDHVTGVIRQAHRSMAEAFPNQVPFVLVDDLPASLTTEVYLGSPDMSPTSGPFDLRELQKDALQMSPPNFHSVMRNGSLVQESDSIDSKKGLGQFNELLGPAEGANHVKSVERRVRKALNFQDAEIKEQGEQKGVTESLKAQAPSESERMSKAELEILMLKTALSNLETEKETGLLQYQQSLERLSNLESEVSRAKEDSKGLNERASKAEAEVKILKESLEKLDAERHASFLQYQECVEKISNMENYISEAQKDADDLNDRASKAETEAQFLTQDLARLEVEKESSLVLYNQCLEKISDMEAKLLHAKETARRSNERADKADKEVEALMQALAIMVEEKEAAAVKYNKCLETITILEHKLTFAQEDATRLNSKIDDGVAKFKDAEERCLQLERSNRILNSELESLTRKMAVQSGELTEKQKELGRLWTSLQEERLRCVEAETAFQTLQRTHSQSQEELRSLATEVQNRVGKIEDLEAVNKRLENEVGQIKVENKGLNEVNLSLALTVQHLKAEISCLRETHGKLEAEVELRVDQRNALQQEIYGLKEELKSLNIKHHSLVEQVESLGIGPDCFVSHVRDLQEENIKLKQASETVGEDEEAFLEKLVVMDKLVEKNIVLEDSLSELNAELEYVRDKVKALEESCKSLQDERSALLTEKSMLVSQLQIASDNLEQLLETKMFMEKSLLDANSELEGLRVKSKCLEDSCRLLDSRSCCREMDIQQLRDRVCNLDVENGELKAQILAHAEVLISFRDCVAALECCFVKHTLQDIDKNEGKDSTSDVCANSYQETTEKPDAVLAGGLLDLKELQARIKAIEMATVEKERHLLLENSMANSKLEAAMRKIEDLKSKSSLPRERIRKGKHVNLMVRPDQNKDLKPLKGAYEISEERSEVTTKDIMLDETSECSSIGFSNSRRDTTEADDPLEIWEAAFNEGSIDLTVEKAPKVTRSRSQRKHHSREHQRRRTESFAEKDVGMDKLEVSRSSSGSCHEVHERKILEIIDSDAQKLTNLHITVQDLKRTVEVTDKSRKGISIEYDSVKEQLEESEEAIIKLFNVNLRLKRNMEIESPSLEDNSPLASNEKGSIKRRKIAEQARKVSEKIGRLQLEVQKLQFLLLKLDDQNKTRPKIKIMERKTRVLLRDYLYSSGTRTRLQKPKKGHFCACAQPSTRGD